MEVELRAEVGAAAVEEEAIAGETIAEAAGSQPTGRGWGRVRAGGWAGLSAAGRRTWWPPERAATTKTRGAAAAAADRRAGAVADGLASGCWRTG